MNNKKTTIYEATIITWAMGLFVGVLALAVATSGLVLLTIPVIALAVLGVLVGYQVIKRYGDNK